MQLKLFLDQIQNESTVLENQSIIVFTIPDGLMPVVFIAHLISFLKAKQHPIEMFSVGDAELSSIFSRLETSFLGMKISYWLRGVDEMDKKLRQQLLSYLAQYNGPHQILLMCAKEEAASYFSKKMCVELPSSVTPDLALLLLSSFKKSNSTSAKHIGALVTKYDTLTLDQICMLIGYFQVVGKPEDYAKIVDRAVESEHSLFTLAQYFFAKNSIDFYKLWNSVEQTYPVTFWCAYWSEQLWRAYHARYFLAKEQNAQAKIVSARLPFSFLQKDWKKVSLRELKNAHQWIYDLDRAYKNNIETQAGIDLFYNKFFLNEFQK